MLHSGQWLNEENTDYRVAATDKHWASCELRADPSERLATMQHESMRCHSAEPWPRGSSRRKKLIRRQKRIDPEPNEKFQRGSHRYSKAKLARPMGVAIATRCGNPATKANQGDPAFRIPGVCQDKWEERSAMPETTFRTGRRWALERSCETFDGQFPYFVPRWLVDLVERQSPSHRTQSTGG